MNDLILDKYSKLPKEIQAQVIDYIDFLLLRYQEKTAIQAESEKSNFGIAKGLIEMTEDFNAPLEDFQDYYK